VHRDRHQTSGAGSVCRAVSGKGGIEVSIKIIDDEVIELTRAQNKKLLQEYDENCKYNLRPPDFESFVKAGLFKNDGTGAPAYPKYRAKAMEAAAREKGGG
jgi:hypothetical protein